MFFNVQGAVQHYEQMGATELAEPATQPARVVPQSSEPV
jgi:hypothetical protein